MIMLKKKRERVMIDFIKIVFSSFLGSLFLYFCLVYIWGVHQELYTFLCKTMLPIIIIMIIGKLKS